MAHFFFKSLYLSLFHISRQNIMSIGTQASQKPKNRNLLQMPDCSEQTLILFFIEKINLYTNNYTFTELVKAIWEQQNENSRCDSQSNTHNRFRKKQPSEGTFFPGRDFNIFAISFLFLEILEWIKKCQNLWSSSSLNSPKVMEKYHPSRCLAILNLNFSSLYQI